MRVLLTNCDLAERGGATLYARDVALALLARGHSPVVYSPILGDVAEELRAAGIAVVRDVRDITEPPHVIHGQQHPETMIALLAFPGVPAVFFCHDFTWWGSAPMQFPRVLRYVAVDHACRDRLVNENGIPAERVELLLNFVDLARFQPRAPLPSRPRRALVFSNYATDENYCREVRAACEAAGIALDVIGAGVGNSSAAPEAVLGEYDLVFAKARAALEAMAVGAAVILCDASGAGPLVTTRNFEELRPLNFGRRALRPPVSSGALASEIARYDAADAAAVSQHLRAHADLDVAVEHLIDLYQNVITEAQALAPFDAAAEARATAAYLQQQAPSLHGFYVLRRALRRLFALPVIGPAARAVVSARRRSASVLRTLDD